MEALKNIIECKSFKEKTSGLINKNSENGIYFETRWGIHTFGMKYPINIFILDDKNKIIKIGKNILPNRFFFWHPKYSKILEIPFALKPNLEINDILELS